MSEGLPTVRRPKPDVPVRAQMIAYGEPVPATFGLSAFGRWFGVLIFARLLVVALMRGDFIGAALYLPLFCVHFPWTETYFERRFEIRLSGGLKLMLSAFILFLAVDLRAGPRRAIPVGAAPLPVLGETCASLVEKFGPDSKLSTLQREEFWEKNISGRAFHWDLRMVDATASNGELLAHYRCPGSNDGHGEVRDTEITLRFPVTARADVLKFIPGAVYGVGGEFADRFTPGKLNAFALPTGTRALASTPR